MGDARRQPFFSLEILFRHGPDARSRAPDFSVPVRQRLWRPPTAGSVVHRRIFRDDTLGSNRSLRRLLRAAIQSHFAAWELCRPDDG